MLPLNNHILFKLKQKNESWVNNKQLPHKSYAILVIV